MTLSPQLLQAPVTLTVLLAACILYNLIFALRLCYAVRLVGAHLPFLRGVVITLQSLFYLCVIPTSAGYDVSRFAKVFSALPHHKKWDLSQAVLLDRVSGLFASLLLAILFLPFIQSSLPLHLTANWKIVLFGLVILILAIGGYFYFGRFKQYMIGIASLCWHNKRRITHLLLISIAAQAVQIACILWVFCQFDILISNIANIIFAQSFANLAAVIPLSFAGASANEGGAVLIMLALGYSPAAALLSASVIYLTKIVGAIFGGAIELWKALFASKTNRNAQPESEASR